MDNIVSGLLDLFGINVIPTDFPSFMFWLCSLLAALYFSKFILGLIFSYMNSIGGMNKK